MCTYLSFVVERHGYERGNLVTQGALTVLLGRGERSRLRPRVRKVENLGFISLEVYYSAGQQVEIGRIAGYAARAGVHNQGVAKSLHHGLMGVAEQHKVSIEILETGQLGMAGHEIFLERVPGAGVGHKDAFALQLYCQGRRRFFEVRHVMWLCLPCGKKPGSMLLQQHMVMVSLNHKSLSFPQEVYHIRLKSVLVNQVAHAEESIDIAHGRQRRPQPHGVAVYVCDYPDTHASALTLCL